MPELKVDIQVWCSKCSTGLCSGSQVDGLSIYVDPCDVCLATAREDGESSGYDEGKLAGYDQGYSDGRIDGDKNS